jgi:hypothetical protein
MTSTSEKKQGKAMNTSEPSQRRLRQHASLALAAAAEISLAPASVAFEVS